MTTTYEYTGTLEIVECANCHQDFGVQPRIVKERRRDHGTFYCPLGHHNYYPQKSDVERLRERVADAEATATRQIARADQAEAEAKLQKRIAAANKGTVTKMRKRIGRGVCPCCNRQFENLARHMASKHPDVAGGDES